MKRLILSTGFVTILSIYPMFASAQTITRAEVEAYVPQLQNAVSSVGTTVNYIQARIATENDLFRAYSSLLGAYSNRFSQTPGPTNAEIQSMTNSVVGMRNQIAIAADWRSRVNTAIPAITLTLSNISTIISRAI